MQGGEVFFQRQTDKVNRALDRLESLAATLDPNGVPSLGEIQMVVLAEYLDFRQPIGDWRSARPALSSLVQALGQRPSFQATQPAE